MGSIALWMRLDGAAPEILLPNARQKFVTRRNFSYYRFHVSDGVGAFRLSLTNCKQRVGTSSRRQLEHCIDYADVRPRALPFRDPYSPTARHNITQEGAHFDEDRVAARGADYYLLVVTREEVGISAIFSFDRADEHLPLVRVITDYCDCYRESNLIQSVINA